VLLFFNWEFFRHHLSSVVTVSEFTLLIGFGRFLAKTVVRVLVSVFDEWVSLLLRIYLASLLIYMGEYVATCGLLMGSAVSYTGWRWPSFVVPYLWLLFSLFGGLGSVTLNRYVYDQTRSFVHVFYTIYKHVH